MEYLIALLLGIIGSLIAWEISLRHRKWCEAIIRSAVRRLPDEQRAIREEEWLAGLNDCVGLVSSFSHAAGCWVGAPAVAASAKKAVRAVKDSTKDTASTIRIEIAIKRTRVYLFAKMVQESSRSYADFVDSTAQIGLKSGANMVSTAAGAVRFLKFLVDVLRNFF